MSLAEPIVNAMSVDVEDYFQVSAFESTITRNSWDSIPCRVEKNTQRVLELFAEHDVKATFFTLGWVAERFPGLVQEIANAGHEVASHGYSHVRATEQTPREFAEDISRTKALLEDASGQAVKGYRAASFSIGAHNLWALDEIEAAGYRYSSSVNPIRHDLYGMPDAPRFAFHPASKSLTEVPITTLRLFGTNVPCGGGGYFRLLPYAFFKWAIRRVNRVDRQPSVFYFHPWEIDPEQPRRNDAPLKTKFRHYNNLDRMEPRLRRLLADFRWGRMDEVYLDGSPVAEVDLDLTAASRT